MHFVVKQTFSKPESFQSQIPEVLFKNFNTKDLNEGLWMIRANFGTLVIARLKNNILSIITSSGI